MLQMDLTQVNVLTKIDNLHKFPDLPFNLDYYTEVQDLDYLLPALERESPMFATGKFASLNKAVCQLIEEFGLVGYETLAVEDKKSMIQLLRTIDRANGYVFGGAEGAGDGVWQTAIRQGMGEMSIKDVQDRWIDNKEWWDEKERQEEEEEQEKRQKEWEINMSRTGGGMDGMNLEGMDEEELAEMMRMPPDSGVKVKRPGQS